jgi:hypothetical protein
MTTGGYSAVARYLTQRYDVEPPVSRGQVYAWNTRRTENQAGQPFPSPVAERTAALRTTARLCFDFEDVARWYEAGVPGPQRKGWETPASRRERYEHPTPADLMRRRMVKYNPPRTRRE